MGVMTYGNTTSNDVSISNLKNHIRIECEFFYITIYNECGDIFVFIIYIFISMNA